MPSPARHRLYHDLAELWPLISPLSDYEPEARYLVRLVSRALGLGPRRRTDRLRVLELGSGGGHIAHHLARAFDLTVSDLSPRMIAQCRRLNPHLPAHVGDMRTLRLTRQLGRFDAVLIHDAIDYMVHDRDIAAALRTAHAHLRPDGVVVVAPTYTRDTFIDHDYEADQHSDGHTTVTYLSTVHDPDPDDGRYESHLVFIIQRGARTRIVPDRHVCGLRSTAQWLTLLKEAGFDAQPEADLATHRPHVLLVGRRT